MPSNNDNLHNALKQKNNEFYTRYEDIELECSHYIKYFLDKIIYLNCDTEESNFWKYFINNFTNFGLKCLISTHLEEPHSYVLLTKDGNNIQKVPLKGNGSYKSAECIAILNKADIVITNPPFSESKEFIKLISDHNKEFLVIGNENSFSSTLLFPLFKEQKLWTGINKIKTFILPNGSTQDFGNICWLTNILCEDNNKDFIILTSEYSPEKYDKYTNFDAINVERIKDIPKNYKGVMGVPISIVGKYNPNQFIIEGLAAGNTKTNKLNYNVPYTPHHLDRGGCGIINDTIRKYTRVFIRIKD